MSCSIDFKQIHELLSIDKPEPVLLKDLDVILGLVVFFGPMIAGLPTGIIGPIVKVAKDRDALIKAGQMLFEKLSNRAAGDQLARFGRVEKASVLLPYAAFVETVHKRVPAIAELPEEAFKDELWVGGRALTKGTATVDSLSQVAAIPKPPYPATDSSLTELLAFYERYADTLEADLRSLKIVSISAATALGQLQAHRRAIPSEALILFKAEYLELCVKYDRFRIYRDQQRDAMVARELRAIRANGQTLKTESPHEPATITLLQSGATLLQPRFGELFGPGRRRQSNELAKLLAEDFRGIYYVHGAPGIGKSELCRAAIRKLLEQNASAKAIHIDVISAQDYASFEALCCSSLGLPTTAGSDALHKTVSKIAEGGLLVAYFENFETVGGEQEILSKVASLAEITGVRVLCSTRVDLGSELGRGIFVSRLDSQSSCDLFLACWKRNQKAPALERSSDLATFIDNRLSNHPLSIVLTAARGATYGSLTALIEEWDSQPFEVASSLENTLDRSFLLLSHEQSVLLFLISIHPSGISSYKWDRLVETEPFLRRARYRLSELNLIEDSGGREAPVSILAPIREYVLAKRRPHFPMDFEAACSKALGSFAAIARNAGDPRRDLYTAMASGFGFPPLAEDSDEASMIRGVLARDELAPSFGDILAVLNRIDIEPGTPLLGILGSLAAEIRNWCGYAHPYLGLAVARRLDCLCRGSSDELAQAHTSYAVGITVRNKEARQYLEKAEAIYRRSCFLVGLADTLLKLHELERSPEKKRALMDEAVELYRRSNNPLGRFSAAVRQHSSDQRDEAEMYFNSLEQEISRLRADGPSSELANAIQTWAGYQEFAEKRKDVALELYEEAAKLFRLLGNRSRLAESLLDAGRLQYHLRRLDDARSTLHEALREFEAISNPRGSARTHIFLALIANRAGDQAESRSQREQASAIAPDDDTRRKMEHDWILHADDLKGS